MFLTPHRRQGTINVVIKMSWKGDFKNCIDFTYNLAKKKFPDIKFPCYGGRFYWFLVDRHTENIYFYLTEKSLLYTESGVYFTEIPFKNIRKLSVKKSAITKSMFHIRLVADKRHHLFIYCKEDFSTDLTGNAIKNTNNFIAVLQSSVNVE